MPFKVRSYWISYSVFALIALVVAYGKMDIADAGIILLATMVPIPFFLFGFLAKRVSFSILYALAVLVTAILFMLFVAPAVLDLWRR